MLTYYINLAGRTDRRAFMEAQFQRLGLAATRIDAATPCDISPRERVAYCHPSRPHWLGEREYACTLSHFRAMTALLAGSEPMALVLEDDVVLSPRLPDFLAAFEQDAPTFDLLRVETCGQRLRVRRTGEPLAGVDLVRFVGYDSGAGGYVVSRSGARHILANEQSRLRPIDQALFDSSAPLAREITVWQTMPGMCAQSKMDISGVPELVSDLGNGDARPAAEAPWVWRHRWHRLKRALYRDTVLAVKKQWFVHAGGAELVRIPFLGDA